LEEVAAALRGIQLCVLSTAPVKMISGDDPFLTCIIRPDTGTMRQLIEGSSLVVTRAGYTSVMELVSLGKGAVLIPTPGQPEQEYLGDYLNGHHGFITVKQQKIKNLRTLVESYMDPPQQLPDTVSAVGNSSQLPYTVPPVGNSSQQLPDSADLFDQALTLLLEQKKE
ncbi:MAG: glycosyltransferase, partial [Bacteroidales bacterium]